MASDPISTLNNLIQTCRDGQEGLTLAAEQVKDQRLRDVLRELASERGSLAEDLQREVGRLGGTAATSGSISGVLHRGWLDLRAAVTTSDEHVLAEAERGEDVAKETFESAVRESGTMDTQTQAVIRRVADRVIAAHDRVRELERTWES